MPPHQMYTPAVVGRHECHRAPIVLLGTSSIALTSLTNSCSGASGAYITHFQCRGMGLIGFTTQAAASVSGGAFHFLQPSEHAEISTIRVLSKDHLQGLG